MASEIAFQREIVLKFLTDKVYGLGYKQVSANTIDNRLIIESDVIDFLKTPQNEENYQLALKDYKGDEELFHQDYISEVARQAYRRQSTVFFFQDQTMTFKTPLGNSYSFIVFNTAKVKLGHSITTDPDFSQNIFSVVEELTFLFEEGNILIRKRPDLCFFLNGVYIDLLELKKEPDTAKVQGRKKVVHDLIESVKQVVKNGDESADMRSRALRLYEKGIRLAAMDRNEIYVLRVPAAFYPDIQREANKASDQDLREKITKEFRRVPFNSSRNNVDNFKEALKCLYSPEAIENEILYYNLLEKNMVRDVEKGKAVPKNTLAPIHTGPRPNQKHGVDKLLNRVEELYLHEHDEEFTIKELEQQLDSHGLSQISQEKKAEILNNRRLQNNNRSVYSILGQYSAGFGKTNMIGWTALRLKDLLLEDNSYLFDLIILVTDRVDLRDQLDLTMHNMNVQKSLFKEAETKADLEEVLKNNSSRIVIVNVQKFPKLKLMLSEELTETLKKKRVAFIIDEIHRSQSGVQNEEMSNLFDELVTAQGQQDKKNLVVGLTATPSDEILVRYGEYNSCVDKNLQWRPFDAFTMSEAIEEGFVLDPTKHLIPVAVKMEFDEDLTDAEAETKKIPTKKKIYENKSRIQAVSKKIVDFCLHTTFRKIKGRGKSMVKAFSIEAALIYFDEIRDILADKLTDRKYESFKDAQVYIVYSHNQGYAKTSSLNGKSEKEVIRDFKNSKNAIIIVVDKLQTGFDEKTLHTLFLDAEISGINAVQTVCRVNRTIKGKNDCAIVDFSHKNVNMRTIQQAFKKYENMNVAPFDVPAFVISVEKAIKDFKGHKVFKSLYTKYLETISNAVKDQEFGVLLDRTVSQIDLVDFMPKGVLFLELADQARAVLDPQALQNPADIQYRTKKYDKFLIKLKSFITSDSGNGPEKETVDFWFDNAIHETDAYEKVETKEKKPGKENSGGTGDPYGILARLKKMNAEEDEKLLAIKAFQDKLKIVYTKMKELDANERVKIMLLDENTTMDQSEEEFKKLYGKAKRRLEDKDLQDETFWEVADNAKLQLIEEYRTLLTQDQ